LGRSPLFGKIQIEMLESGEAALLVGILLLFLVFWVKSPEARDGRTHSKEHRKPVEAGPRLAAFRASRTEPDRKSSVADNSQKGRLLVTQERASARLSRSETRGP
jgi:hypothetical protein